MKRGRLAAALVVSTLNRAVSSGSNFLLGIYLVRALSPTEFGLFGIGFAVSLFYAGIGNALFLVQMTVLFPERSPPERPSFVVRTLILMLSFCAATVLAARLVLLAGGSFFATDEFASYGMAITLAGAAVLLKNFFVCHAYNVRKESWALIVDSVVALFVFGSLVISRFYSVELTASAALEIYAVAHVAGGVCGYTLSGLSVRAGHRTAFREDLRAIWRGGRWASITSVLEFLRAQSHTIVTAALLGPISVAKMNAARLLVTPALLLVPTISQVAMPRLASIGVDDPKKTLWTGFRLGAALLAVALLFCVALLIAHDAAVSLVLDDRYIDLFFTTALWSAYTCVLSLKSGIEISLQALRRFRQLAIMKAIAAVVSLCATFVLILPYGIAGALIGLISGELMLIALFTTLSGTVKAPGG